MNDFDKYKYLLGETITLYQFMENDLKLIFAGMLKGNFYKNIEYVRSEYKGLGQVIKALEELDNSDATPYFSKDTYFMLSKLARQRNYYCHQCCMDFAYIPDFENSIEFKDSLGTLMDTNKNIKHIQTQIEIHKNDVLSKFNRVWAGYRKRCVVARNF